MEASLENLNLENDELHIEVEKRLNQIREYDTEIKQLKKDTSEVSEVKGKISILKTRHDEELYELQELYKRTESRL